MMLDSFKAAYLLLTPLKGQRHSSLLEKTFSNSLLTLNIIISEESVVQQYSAQHEMRFRGKLSLKKDL